MARLSKPGHRHPSEVIPDFDWTRRVTLMISYDSETDTVVIDRGPLGRTMVEAILELALETLNCSDEEEVDAETED